MSILTLVLVLVVIGVALWLINAYMPMQQNIKTILNLVVVIAVVLWLLKVFGVFDTVASVRV